METEFNTLQFIITLLSSGAIAAIVSGVVQKENEKESRIFNAKLEAYKNFIAPLKSYYESGQVTTKEKTFKREEVSAPVLLISTDEINKKIKTFNSLIRKSRSLFNAGKKKDAGKLFFQIHSLGEEIESLMREDLKGDSFIVFWNKKIGI